MRANKTVTYLCGVVGAVGDVGAQLVVELDEDGLADAHQLHGDEEGDGDEVGEEHPEGHKRGPAVRSSVRHPVGVTSLETTIFVLELRANRAEEEEEEEAEAEAEAEAEGERERKKTN